MSDAGRKGYQKYLTLRKPKAFVVAPDGADTPIHPWQMIRSWQQLIRAIRTIKAADFTQLMSKSFGQQNKFVSVWKERATLAYFRSLKNYLIRFEFNSSMSRIDIDAFVARYADSGVVASRGFDRLFRLILHFWRDGQ